MNFIKAQQVIKFHVLLKATGMADNKRDLIKQVSAGRVESTRDLTAEEADRLIDFLSFMDSRQFMRRKVFALAYQAGIIYGNTPDDMKMNRAKLQSFIMEAGTVKKSLNSMSKQELIKIINQFECIIKNNDVQAAKIATDLLLKEMNLTVLKQ